MAHKVHLLGKCSELFCGFDLVVAGWFMAIRCIRMHRALISNTAWLAILERGVHSFIVNQALQEPY